MNLLSKVALGCAALIGFSGVPTTADAKDHDSKRRYYVTKRSDGNRYYGRRYDGRRYSRYYSAPRTSYRTVRSYPRYYSNYRSYPRSYYYSSYPRYRSYPGYYYSSYPSSVYYTTSYPSYGYYDDYDYGYYSRPGFFGGISIALGNLFGGHHDYDHYDHHRHHDHDDD